MEHLKNILQRPKGTLHAVDDVISPSALAKPWAWWENPDAENPLWEGPSLRLHEPTSGKVYFEGRDILGYNKKR